MDDVEKLEKLLDELILTVEISDVEIVWTSEKIHWLAEKIVESGFRYKNN